MRTTLPVLCCLSLGCTTRITDYYGGGSHDLVLVAADHGLDITVPFVPATEADATLIPGMVGDCVARYVSERDSLTYVTWCAEVTLPANDLCVEQLSVGVEVYDGTIQAFGVALWSNDTLLADTQGITPPAMELSGSLSDTIEVLSLCAADNDATFAHEFTMTWAFDEDEHVTERESFGTFSPGV